MREDPKQWQRVMRYASIGMEFIVSFGLLMLAGLWLDRRIGTLPAFTLVGGALGFGLGLYRLISDVRRDERETKKQQDARDEHR